MMNKKYDYITSDEVNKVYAIKSAENMSFKEMAEEIGTSYTFFSKLVHGKRSFPAQTRINFDSFLEKHGTDLPVIEVETKFDIPQYIILENQDTGDQILYKIPDEVFYKTDYRRSTENNREEVLIKYNAMPPGYHYIDSGLRNAGKITPEEYSKIMLLKRKYKLKIFQLGKMCGCDCPQYWSMIINGKGPLNKEQREKMHQVFETYGV